MTTPVGYNPYTDVIPPRYLDNATITERVTTISDAYVLPAPTLGSLNPSSVSIASQGEDPLTLHVIGTGFVAGSQIHFNGVQRGTRYMTTAELSWTFYPADWTPGPAPVEVVNPDGQISGELTFTFVA